MQQTPESIAGPRAAAAAERNSFELAPGKPPPEHTSGPKSEPHASSERGSRSRQRKRGNPASVRQPHVPRQVAVHHRGRRRVAQSRNRKPYQLFFARPASCIPCTAKRKATRARDNRDMTVPIGIARVAAIS